MTTSPKSDEKRQIGTIDLTPTWSGILPALLAVIENGTPEGQKIAREELQRMATLADMYVVQNKLIEAGNASPLLNPKKD